MEWSSCRGEGAAGAEGGSAAPAYLSVADVRQALLALRGRWFEKMTPDEPFLFSAPVLEAPLEPPSGFSERTPRQLLQPPQPSAHEPQPSPLSTGPAPPRQLDQAASAAALAAEPSPSPEGGYSQGEVKAAPREYGSAATTEAAAEEARAISVSEFGCIFDYGQHIKRHTRSGR
jgi:hypothetical protein